MGPLVKGTFPSIFKTALVKPLLKKPSLDHNDLKNYRPVSNLPFLSKVIERIVLLQLNEHLLSNNLLNPLQSAYRPYHSTETALLKIINDLLTAIDNGKITLLTLLDLSAAFDTIDHNILLKRLQHTCGITESALSWFNSYLSERTQIVTINGFQSNASPLSFGVPQGSVLGPVLFVLYTEPLFNLVKKHLIHHHAFADDNQLYKDTNPHNINQTIEDMQNCITDVKMWMTANKLQLNDCKTEVILISSPRLSTKLALPPSMHVGNSDILFSPSVKNLGVTLDCNLNMAEHVQRTCKAAYIQLRQISSIRHFLTSSATQTLVSTLILSRLDYCNALLSGCPKHLTDRLQHVQNAAARLVFKAKKFDHVQPLLRKLHWLPITSRIQYKISSICFKSVVGIGPQYLTDLLHQYIPRRPLRSSSDSRLLCVPRVSTKTFGERSFSYIGPTSWNHLPFDLRHSKSLSTFRHSLKTHLFNC